MSDLPLAEKSRTSSKITFTYPKVDGAEGYRYYAAGRAVSRTFNPDDLEVTFALGNEPYRVVPLDVSERPEGFVYPPPATPPSQGVPIPTYRVTQPQGGISYWLYGKSPTTQVIGTDGDGFRQRCVVWDVAGGASSARYSGRDMWMLTGMRLVSGYPGRHLNYHVQPNDAPWSWTPPYKDGGPSSDTSPVAFDIWPNATAGLDGLMVVINPNSPTGNGSGPEHWGVMSKAQLDALAGSWIWIWSYIRWGRRDYGPGAGALKVWVAGVDNSPRVNVADINTHWYQEHQIVFIQGGYWSTGTPGYTTEMALTRFGRTPQECYEDVPVLVEGDGQGLQGGPSPGSHTQIEPRLHNEAAIPADIAW